MALKRVGNTIIAAALPAVMIGCTVGPNYKPPAVKTNATFSAKQPATQAAPDPAAVSLERWWESFNDPVLDSLIDRALRTNIDLRIAQSRVREARAQLIIQQAAIYPNLNADGSYERLRLSKEGFYLPGGGGGRPATLSGGGVNPSGAGTLNHVSPSMRRRPAAAGTGAGAGGTSTSNGLESAFTKTEIDTFQGGFDASWELDIFGGVRRSIEAAVADEQSMVESRRDTMISLLSEVARNYVQLRGVQRELAIAYENIRSQQDTVDLTMSRFRAGLTTDLDVARAEAQVATTRATVPGSLTTLNQAVHRIAVLLGQSPTALEAELLRKQAPIPAGPPTVPVGIPSELLRRRPDVRRAERQLAGATARVGAATADLFPRFSLTGSLGLASGSFRNLGRLDSVYYTIGPSISWPIFDAGRIRANIRVQNERENQAAAQYEAVVLTSLEDVENAIVAYSQEQARHHDLQAAVDADRRAVTLAEQLYQKGLTDFLNVLDAQRNLFASEDNLVQSETSLSADVVALYKALGGGWEDLETPPGMQMNSQDGIVNTANQ
ncbi:MAG TPA: efflux transporter outer membrane subunit [Tepidisphaeraceae bacterium]|jgi:NodT family efflux transporter outer membrane factor (OMF) lipoprotein|nr:efflux transporter outer membrane subunit [Tepidisphaeraceae bacterium]